MTGRVTMGSKNNKKIYAVAVGREIGIYESYEKAQNMTNGFSGAKMKSFSAKDGVKAAIYIQENCENHKKKSFVNGIWLPESFQFQKKKGIAKEYLFQIGNEEKSLNEIIEAEEQHALSFNNYCATAFVDGSYLPELPGYYGLGAVLLTHKGSYCYSALKYIQTLTRSGSMIAEFLAVNALLRECVRQNIKVLSVFYDCEGIQHFMIERNKTYDQCISKLVEEFVELRDKVSVHFFKIAGHSGYFGNVLADKCAKEAFAVPASGWKSIGDHEAQRCLSTLPKKFEEIKINSGFYLIHYKKYKEESQRYKSAYKMLCDEIRAFNQKDMKKKRLKSFVQRLKKVISEMENGTV